MNLDTEMAIQLIVRLGKQYEFRALDNGAVKDGLRFLQKTGLNNESFDLEAVDIDALKSNI